jgi:hypothetical protein
MFVVGQTSDGPAISHTQRYSGQLIIVVEIFGGVWRVAYYIDGVALQDRAYLRVVIRRNIIRLLYGLAKNLEIVLISVLGSDEDAYTVLRLGIEIADVTTAEVVNHEAMWWERVHCLFAGGIVGEMNFEARRGQIETVLVEEGLARWFEGKQGRALHKHAGWQDGQRYTDQQD